MAATLASLGFDIKTAPIKGATQELGKMDTATKTVSKSLSAMTAVFGIAAVAAGGLSFSRLISESTNFDTSMRKLQATSRATRDEMKALEDQARALGATTMFSAKETADAQQFLAMAGFRVNEILRATPSVLKLATAANMGLASAADIASNVLGGMRLEVDQLDRVIDVLAATASGSNTSIEQLGHALSMAAPLAASAGVSIEETAAAIGVMSDAGIQGTRAGTGLVGVIRQLSNVTPAAEEALLSYGLKLKDVDINALGLAKVLDNVKNANISTADSFKIFGSQSGAAAQVLAAGAERLSTFTGELNKAEGAAKDMADIIGGGLMGSWASFNSAVSESIIKLGRDEGVAGGFQAVVDTATGVLSVYNDMLPQFAEANNLTETQAANLYSIAEAIKVIAAISVIGIAGKYIGSTVAAAGATLAKEAAIISSAKATAAATAVELSYARSVQGSLVSQLANAKTTAAASAIRLQLAANTSVLTAANNANAAAMARSTVTARAATAAMAGLRAATAFLGGPVGVLAIAAIGLYYFTTRASDAEKESLALEKRIDSLGTSFDSLGKAQATAALIDYNKKLEDLQFNLQGAKNLAEDYAKQASSYIGSDVKRMDELTEKVARSAGEYERLTDEVKKTEKAISDLRKIQMGETASSAAASEPPKAEDAIIRTTDAARDMAIALEEAHLKLKLGERAFLEYKLASFSATDQQTKFALASFDAVTALEDEAKAADDARAKLDRFRRGIESQSQRVADSLQNAITTGDWAGIGATVGATLASGIASAVAAKFAGESMIAMIGAPMLGALAGGLAGLAASKIGGLFSSSYVDPTAERQRTQGTGTVLGSIDAKSESIAKATDIAAKASHELIGINRGMLRALEAMQSGIEGASTRIAMAGTPDFNIREAVHNLTDKNFGAKIAGGITNTVGSIVTLGLYNSLGSDIGKLLGGKTKLTDSGLNIGGGAIGSLGGNIAAYQGSKSKSWSLGSYSNNADVTAQIDADAKRQFGLVYESIIDTIAESGKVFGITEQEIRKVNVAAQKLSLKGLNAEQQQKELEAYFSKVFDTTTKAVFDWLNNPKLAKAGEGLGETMVRVATNIQTAEEAARQLGFTMGGAVKEELALASQTLIEAAGGVDQFASSMKSFISSFATEAQQFEINQGALNRALADAKLPLADSRAGYWELMQAQDASTKAGAENIATLLRLQGAADSYYSTLEKKEQELHSKRQEAANEQLRTQQTALGVALSNAAAVSQALGGLNTQNTASSRESALASIREMTRTGNIGDDLQSTLASATAINAADFATFNDYVRTVARTGEALGGLKGVTDAKVTREQELLAGIERRIEAMAEELALIGKSNAKHTSKTAAILERIELDGIDIREVENA